ncbi:MAG TPA: M20/M25/M40 family metallo-hydrolase [Ignavibacteria bacterium]
MRIKILLALLILVISGKVISQSDDSLIIRNIYSEALTSSISYENLRYLCKNIGGRICGSPQSEIAIDWVKNVLKDMNLDNVYLQECRVKQWVRGEKEISYINSSTSGKYYFNCCALGMSIGTGEDGISANVIEVKSFDELKSLGREKVGGKIVFFSRAADQRFINTGSGYGSAVDQRVHGAIEAAKLGAIGVVIRSATVAFDSFPHTGIMRYEDSTKRIPAIAISTKDAERLSNFLKNDPSLNFYFRTTCIENPEVKSYNVIGEIKGSEFPEEIILVGGHLDSWDTGEGAHDDGAGIVQGIEVLRLYKELNIKPKHTIRFVAYMDEEIAQRGARKYAEIVKSMNEKHIAAIESDGGGFTPTGFSIDASDTVVSVMQKWLRILRPYDLFFIEKGGSGVDVWFLKDQGFPLIGLDVDSQRYFDSHHSPNDVFEKVNRRELQLGSAAMASLIYLIDEYGLK